MEKDDYLGVEPLRIKLTCYFLIDVVGDAILMEISVFLSNSCH